MQWLRSKNSHYVIGEIRRRHWITQGQRDGFSAAEVEEMIAALQARTEAIFNEVAAILPRDYPADVADAIFAGMRRQNRRLSAAA